jgi:hypothetical protein
LKESDTSASKRHKVTRDGGSVDWIVIRPRISGIVRGGPGFGEPPRLIGQRNCAVELAGQPLSLWWEPKTHP